MKTQTQSQNLITKKEARQIEMLGEAKNLDSYKSHYDLVVMDGQLELDQHISKVENTIDSFIEANETIEPYQIGCGDLPIFGRFNFSGSLN